MLIANSIINVGRHNCLWCHIPGSMLKVPLSQRKSCQPRSLETLKHDHARFLSEAHGDLKQAKNYNNVIGDIMFEIPIDQVRLINKLKIQLRLQALSFLIGLHTWPPPFIRNFQPAMDTSRGCMS